MKADSVKISTVPLPERPLSFEIPVKLLHEFEKEARIVVRHPWLVGIPVPEVLMQKLAKDPGFYRELMGEFEIMLVPK